MQNLTDLSDKAWVSLLWSQYNLLSEPVKEGFINLAHKIAEETENQNINFGATSDGGHIPNS
jgi:hypothetical protein